MNKNTALIEKPSRFKGYTKNILTIHKYEADSLNVSTRNTLKTKAISPKGANRNQAGQKSGIKNKSRSSLSVPPLKFIDLFAGIGGFRLAFENSGAKCVFSSEWDRFARITYEANFGEIPAGDIRKIDSGELPPFDILCAGFPCQPFSIAGVSKKNSLGCFHGFQDKKQGDLFFEIVRILNERKPRAFVLENVKNLLSHNKGKTFERMLEMLSGIGYNIKYNLLNASSMLPQNRNRLFMIGFRYKSHAGLFEFPDLDLAYRNHNTNSGKQKRSRPALRDILDRKADSRYILTDHLWNYLKDYKEKHRRAGNGFGYGLTDLNGITRTLSARYYKDGSEILVPVRGQNPRRLTPRECARLMGFPDSFIIPVSDTQAYRQFGNAVAVPVVEQLACALIRVFKMTARGRKSKKRSTKKSSIKKISIKQSA